MTHQQEICQPKFSQKSVMNTKRNLNTFSQQIVSKVLQTNSSVPYHFVRYPPLWTTSYLFIPLERRIYIHFIESLKPLKRLQRDPRQLASLMLHSWVPAIARRGSGD